MLESEKGFGFPGVNRWLATLKVVTSLPDSLPDCPLLPRLKGCLSECEILGKASSVEGRWEVEATSYVTTPSA